MLAGLLLSSFLAATTADVAQAVAAADPAAVVADGLASPTPLTRATAARLAAVRDVKSALPTLRTLAASEKDGDAAREELRALIILGTDEDVALAAKSSARFPARMDAAVGDAVARLGAPRSVDLYLADVKPLRHISNEANFFTLALWGRPELLTASAARVLGSQDERGWRELLEAARDARLPIGEGVLTAGAGATTPRLREATLWHLVRTVDEEHPMGAGLKEAATTARADATPREAFARELVRRAGGGTPAAEPDPRFATYLATPEAKQDLGTIRPALLTDGELHALGVAQRPASPPSGATKAPLPATSFLLPSTLPAGVVDAVFSSSLCSTGWLGVAAAAVDRAGRVRQLDLSHITAEPSCNTALATLTRLSLVQPATMVSTFTAGDLLMVQPNRVSVCLDEPSVGDALHVGRIARVGRDVRAPSVVRQIDPIYPEAVRKKAMETNAPPQIVTVEALVSATGCVRPLRIVKAATFPDLNAAALEALAQWTVSPSKINDEPVPAVLNVTIHFKAQ
ncbi:MAG TPA: TonB family protein [Thermoanaerobaculia bacterium]|jgi:TonB family protein|nr:TonB family protein [Thermoanaerobaculia bacterium]